jgi:hypothetical protein
LIFSLLLFTLFNFWSLQPLSAGKYENSIWKDVADDVTIVDKELIQKLFKMNPGAMRADIAKRKFVCGLLLLSF